MDPTTESPSLGFETPEAALAAVASARFLGRLDEANQTARDATARFPGQAGLIRERALLAAFASDWTAAEAFWRACLALDATGFDASAGLAESLRRQGRAAEAEAVPLSSLAHLAAFAREVPIGQNPEEAGRRWDAVRTHFPDEPESYAAGAEAARHLRRFEAAAAILREAIARFGAMPDFLRELAWLADGQRDWPRALACWQRYIGVDPSPWWAYYGLATALTRLGRDAEVDALMLQRQAEVPSEIMYFILHAENAEQTAAWEAAHARWETVRRRFPDRPEGYEGAARSLRQIRQFDRAAPVLVDAASRFPDSPTLLLEIARLSRSTGHTDEALRALEQSRQRFPHGLAAYLEAGEILREAGRLDEAEAVLSAAMKLFPNDWSIWRQTGLLAEARGDWQAAVAHWQAMGQRFPGPESESWRLHQAILRLGDTGPEAAEAVARAIGMQSEITAEVSAGETQALRELVLSFMSFGGSGGTGGCEFGIFQRFGGAEPLDLLRWATVLPATLIAGLTARFEGMGDPETTEVYLHDNDPDQLWQIHDTRFGVQMHSFVPARDVPAGRMAVSARKRMHYLKNKLLDDLREASKIFVLKLGDRQPTQTELDGIGQALRAHGPGELLCVCPPGGLYPEGTIVAHAPGVSVGAIDFLNPGGQDARMPAWRALCEAMLRLHPR